MIIIEAQWAAAQNDYDTQKDKQAGMHNESTFDKICTMMLKAMMLMAFVNVKR